MPFDPKPLNDKELLDKLRRMYYAARSKNSEVRREMSDMDRFIDGHQWPERDLRVLRDQRRPALVFNICAPKIQGLVGQYADTRMTPTVLPKGNEDKAKAELRNKLLESMRQRTQRAQLDRERYETHLVMGEENVMLQVEPDHDRPSWVHLELVQLDSRDVDWDASARRRDYSDADYVCTSRWIGKTKFLNLYPDKEKQFDELLTRSVDEFFDGDISEWSPLERRGPEDYNWGVWSRREQKQVRLINLQWKCRVWRSHLVDTRTGESEVIEGDDVNLAKLAIEDGEVEGYQVVRAHDIVVYEAEFIGTELLTPKSEILEERPMEGFSVCGSACYMERTTGRPYGALRNLVDPQRDLNKGITMSNEALTGQGRTGWIAEHDAIDSKSAFEQDVQRTGGVALVRDMQRVRERTPAQLSPAIDARIGRTLEMSDLISSVTQTAESPSRAQEAAATVALREKKSLRAYQFSRDTFDHVNMRIDRKILEVVARAMPVSQIMSLLADPERYQLQGEDVIMDMELQTPVAIKDIRELDFDIELQTGADSELTRMTHLNVLQQLATNGVPVDPSLMLEMAAANPSQRERLTEYAQQAQQSQAEAAQAQQQAQAQLLGAQAQAQGQIGEAQLLRAQAQMAKVQIDAEGDAADRSLKGLEIFIDGYNQADASEKEFVLKRAEQLLKLTAADRGTMQ